MKSDRRALNEWMMGACHIGVVECVMSLSCMGWKNDEIAATLGEMMKCAGNEAVRASGLNGGQPVPNLHEHMREWAHRQAGMEVAR